MVERNDMICIVTCGCITFYDEPLPGCVSYLLEKLETLPLMSKEDGDEMK